MGVFCGGMKIAYPFRSMKIRHYILSVVVFFPAIAAADVNPEHFTTGEMRASLSWDSVSAMETKVLRFGASVGIHIKNGFEIGFEQQFIVPPKSSSESRSWSYIRLVPFRNWAVSPFIAARAGYYLASEHDAVGLGAGIGAVIFIDRHFAFEASFYTQGVFSQVASPRNENELDCRVIVFF
jgi:hypothetical protein